MKNLIMVIRILTINIENALFFMKQECQSQVTYNHDVNQSQVTLLMILGVGRQNILLQIFEVIQSDIALYILKCTRIRR